MDRVELYIKKALLVEVTSLQIELSKSLLYPQLDQLLKYCTEFRAELDQAIQIKKTLPNAFKKLNNQAFEKYPIGRCSEITDAFLAELDQNMPDFLLEFQRKGGVIKRVWGNIRDEFFQTAVQMGSYLIDVANDTVDIAKPQIAINALEDIRFKNIDTLEEFIQIKKSYHQAEIFVNSAIPEIFENYPLLQKRNGRLTFIESLCLPYLKYIGINKIPDDIPNLSKEDQEKVARFFKQRLFDVWPEHKKKETQHELVSLFNKISA